MIHKRVLFILLALVLVVGMLPVAAQAAALDCEPYADLQMEYSETVSAGTIRYIRQMPGLEHFYEAYWPEGPFGGYASPRNECGTAVISMALGYVGVDMTPKALLEARNGYTYFSGWGPELIKPSVTEGMQNYIDGEGKYSPVIIHLDYYTGRGHYVILAGRVSENVYIVVDPVKNYTYEMTVNGRTCEFLGQTDYIDEVIQYYNPDAVIEEPPVEEHVCDQGEYLYYYAEHPHHSVYRCAQCGQIWVDVNSANEMPGCGECVQPDAPDQPETLALKDMKASYTHREAVLFHWSEITDAVRYSLTVERETEEGWEIVLASDPAEMGLAMPFGAGTYRAQIIAHSGDCPDDISGCVVSEFHYFTVVELWDNPFDDVDENGFYCDAAIWAYYGGITTGLTETTFGPEGKCTRGQVVTFLWRLAGEPQPESGSDPFVDVKRDSYCYTAALWAAENGITTGVDATHFAPDRTCTRAEVVTFLWRAADKPEAASEAHSFTDLSDSGFYYDAVLWAVEAGITSGTSAATFAPNSTCIRSQVVTFLYRYANN